METDDTHSCMATRSNVLAGRGPNRRATSLTQLSSNVAGPSWDETMLSNSSEMGVTLQSQVTSRKPPANIEELNATTRRARGITSAGMAGPANSQHP